MTQECVARGKVLVIAGEFRGTGGKDRLEQSIGRYG